MRITNRATGKLPIPALDKAFSTLVGFNEIRVPVFTAIPTNWSGSGLIAVYNEAVGPNTAGAFKYHRWNGAAWEEIQGDETVTSRQLAPNVVIESATGQTLADNAADVDITGCSISITPAIASVAMVWAIVDMEPNTAGDIWGIELDVDGVDQANQVICELPAGQRATLGQIWLVALTAAAHTLKLQGSQVTGTGTCSIGTHTRLMLLLLGDANATIS